MQISDAMLLELFTRSLSLWWVILPGMLLGVVVGILPGFSAQNTLIILLPLTLHMDIESGMAFMIALYCTTQLGGGIPAILFNMPGEGGAVATTLDGYPMTKKGQAQQALVLCFAASAFGGLITTIATMAALPLLAQLGLYFRSVEMVVVIVFGLTLIAAIAAQDLLKGLIAGFFGLMIGAIGVDPVFGTPRATFGLLELYDGVPLIPALIGLFAISEAFVMLESETIVRGEDLSKAKGARWSDTLEGLWITAQILVADRLDLDDRPRHRHPARRRLDRRGLSRLPLFEAPIEDARALRHRPSARRHRSRIGEQRRDLGNAGPGVRARHPGRHHGCDHDDRAHLPRHRARAASVHRAPGFRLRASTCRCWCATCSWRS